MQLLLMIIGAVTIIGAVLMALIQHDLKVLLSYHAVSQVGYMILGIATLTPVGIAGGIFHMLNNAIYKCCLFLCAGAVEKKAGTTDLDRLGGLGLVSLVDRVGEQRGHPGGLVHPADHQYGRHFPVVLVVVITLVFVIRLVFVALLVFALVCIAVLMLVCGLGILAIERFRVGAASEF